MAGGRVEVLPKGKATVYLRRAENLLKTMEWAETEGNPDGVATNAVQASIALADAYTVFFLQQRSRGQDHREVVVLLARTKTPNASEVGRLVQRILNRKSEVEYQDRDVRMSDARELAKFTRKLYSLISTDLA